MSLTQGNSGSAWSESVGADAAIAGTPMHLVADSRVLAGYTLEAIEAGNPTAARLLSDARSGFTVHDGADNPSALAEVAFVDVGSNGNVITYE